VPEQSDALPLFVGPATLELAGSRGTDVWDEVRFGAREAVALVTVEDAERPCSTRVRLPTGGAAEDSGDDTTVEVPAEAGHRSVDATVLAVDYATSRLRVDSDCERWSLALTPITDPELPYTVSRRTYRVRGDTLAELAPQTRRVRGTFAAYTRWDTDWSIALAEHATGCDVIRGDLALAARIVLPEWHPPDDVGAAVIRRWRRFLENLETHELGHVTIALQGAHAIDALLDEGLTAETCGQAARRADGVASETHDRWERINARYDERTEHGLAQGTGLDRGSRGRRRGPVASRRLVGRSRAAGTARKAAPRLLLERRSLALEGAQEHGQRLVQRALPVRPRMGTGTVGVDGRRDA
jgi:predicted secreted Zn-dependent protease